MYFINRYGQKELDEEQKRLITENFKQEKSHFYSFEKIERLKQTAVNDNAPTFESDQLAEAIKDARERTIQTKLHEERERILKATGEELSRTIDSIQLTPKVKDEIIKKVEEKTKLRYAIIQDEDGLFQIRFGAEGEVPSHSEVANKKPALAAGNITISKDGNIIEISNKSGDFEPLPKIFPLVLFALTKKIPPQYKLANEVNLEVNFRDSSLEKTHKIQNFKATKPELEEYAKQLTKDPFVETEGIHIQQWKPSKPVVAPSAPVKRRIPSSSERLSKRQVMPKKLMLESPQKGSTANNENVNILNLNGLFRSPKKRDVTDENTNSTLNFYTSPLGSPQIN